MATLRRRVIVFGAMLLLLSITKFPAAGQTFCEGTRLRVTAGDHRVVGTVAETSPDSLVMISQDGQRLSIPRSDIDRVESSLGMRGSPWRGALVGAAVMTVIMVVEAGRQDDGVGDLVLIAALPMGAGLGAGIGALVGLAWRTERWARVPVELRPAVDLTIRGSASGPPTPAVTLALRF